MRTSDLSPAIQLGEKMRKIIAIVVALAAFSSARVVSAGAFTEWLPDEIYSNASGSVQFIDFGTSQNVENFLLGQEVTTNGHMFTFPSSLPSSSTAGKHFLVGTPGYVALSGLLDLAPVDYLLPANNFFNFNGDHINIPGSTVPALTFTTGQLPTDGLDALFFDGTNLTTAINTEIDFAGNVSSIPEPCSLSLIPCAALAMRRRRRSGSGPR
jgi:hypothetical protein